jgi:hypothetical protein
LGFSGRSAHLCVKYRQEVIEVVERSSEKICESRSRSEPLSAALHLALLLYINGNEVVAINITISISFRKLLYVKPMVAAIA